MIIRINQLLCFRWYWWHNFGDSGGMFWNYWCILTLWWYALARSLVRLCFRGRCAAWWGVMWSSSLCVLYGDFISRVCMVFSGVVSVSHGLLTCLVNMVFEFGVLVSISVCMLARGIMVQLLSRSGTKMKILKLTENSNLTSDSGFPSLITYILTIHLSKSDQEWICYPIPIEFTLTTS
jgi:hypothetical protein